MNFDYVGSMEFKMFSFFYNGIKSLRNVFFKGAGCDNELSLEMKEKFLEILKVQFEFERKCGYDEKIGMAAVGKISCLIREVSLKQNVKSYCKEVMKKTQFAFDMASLDGEYSSEKSSIGSILNSFNALISKSEN